MVHIRNSLPNASGRSNSFHGEQRREKEYSRVDMDETEDVLEGYLEKTGKYNPAWKKRWCKLLKKQKQLLYYDDNQKNTKQYKDKVDLNTVTAIHKVETKNHPFSFILVTPDRRYKFSASSAEDRETWYDAVSSCIR